MGRRVIGIYGSLIWSKILMELIFNTCGEFRWSPEGPVSQIHSPRLHVAAPGIFSDLLRTVQMLKREWVRKATGSYRTYSSLVKLHPRFLSLQWKTYLWAVLQPWCLSLQWRTCPWAEHWYIYIYIYNVLLFFLVGFFIFFKQILRQVFLTLNHVISSCLVVILFIIAILRLLFFLPSEKIKKKWGYKLVAVIL